MAFWRPFDTSDNEADGFMWIKEYDAERAISDAIAGVTVGFTLIPQSIAYASLAGLDPQYGLYSSLCGGIIYLFFGTIPELSIAPTALISLLTFSYTNGASVGNVNAAIFLCFFAGCIELLCGIAHLGFLVNFVSTPVTAAFTSAGAMTIASSQVKSLFGLKFQAEKFFDIWIKVFEHIKETKLWDTVLGLSCCTILLLMRKLKDYGAPIVDRKGKPKEPILKKCIWFLSVGRNALVVIGCSVLAFVLDRYGQLPFSLTGKVPGGFPEISLPPFTVETDNRTITFGEMISELQTGIIFIPLISIVSNVGIAKAFAHGKVVDASQEMIAVGMCNIVGSFFKSYPVTASFSRGAVGSASGIRTPFAGIYTATLVILSFTLLTPYFPYIPKPTLAAVIICAVIFMVEVMMTKQIWNIYKIDLIPFFITLISSLIIGIEMGILIGILVDLAKILYLSSKPKLSVEYVTEGKISYMKVTPTSSILFSSAEYVRENLLGACMEKGAFYQYIIVNCERIQTMDYTAAMCMLNLTKDLKSSDKTLIFVNVPDGLEPTLGKAVGESCAIFHNITELDNFLLSKLDENTNIVETVLNGVSGTHL